MPDRRASADHPAPLRPVTDQQIVGWPLNALDADVFSSPQHWVRSAGWSQPHALRPFRTNAAWLALNVMAHNLARWTTRMGVDPGSASCLPRAHNACA